MDLSYFELFSKGTDFNRIHFLDNFYNELNISQETEENLTQLLTVAINNSTSVYIKRSAFKIMCDLALVRKITNSYSVVGILQNFLLSDQDVLQTIALKYLPHFAEARTDSVKNKLIELSDNQNGEVSSQAYYSLGLIQLSKSISEQNIAYCIISLKEAKVHFLAAFQSSENRTDAEFYLLFIDWCDALLSNDESLVSIKFRELENNLFLRIFYEFTDSYFELDFLVFQLTQKIKISFDILKKSKQWLEIPSQMEALFRTSLEIQKIKNTSSSNEFILKGISNNVLDNIENNILAVNLISEKERLQTFTSQVRDSLFVAFIEKIVTSLPDNTERSENPELLALLAENLGSESGLHLYSKIADKCVSTDILKALGNLLRKNKNNELPYRTGSIIGEDVFLSLAAEIERLLPRYPKEKRDIFFNIVEEVIRYARVSFVGNDKKRFPFLFSKVEEGKGQDAKEQDLQDSMIVFFEHSKIADGLEHEKAKFVDGGRVDILYKKDLITIPLELKKSLNRPDENSLNQNYIAQTQTYSAGYDQLGIFILLELSDKSADPPPDFKDWFKVHHLETSSNMSISYPDYIISVVIPGNRTSPSFKSTYR